MGRGNEYLKNYSLKKTSPTKLNLPSNCQHASLCTKQNQCKIVQLKFESVEARTKRKNYTRHLILKINIFTYMK